MVNITVWRPWWVSLTVLVMFLIGNLSGAAPGYSIREYHGVPTVFDGDEPLFVNIYFNPGWSPEAATCHEAQRMKQSGVHMYHQAATLDWGEAAPSGGSALQGGNFGNLEKRLRAILAMDSQARFFLNVHSFPPGEWRTSSPGELWQDAQGKAILIPSEARAAHSFASLRWRREVESRLEAFLRRLQEKDFYPRVVGVHLFVGDEGQWTWYRPDPSKYPEKTWLPHSRAMTDHSPAMLAYFRDWLRSHYRNDLGGLRRAWADEQVRFETAMIPTESEVEGTNEGIFRNPANPTNAKVADYFSAYANCRVEALIGFGKVVKSSTKNRPLLSGAYYGALLYHAIGGGRNTLRHLFGYDRFVSAPEIDYYVSPPFHGCTEMGGPMMQHFLADSLIAEGKFLILEHDLPTHLKEKDLHPFDSKSPTNLQGSLAMLGRSQAYLNQYRMGVWWWDFELVTYNPKEGRQVVRDGSVWYGDEAIWASLSNYGVWGRNALERDSSPVAEIAVIYSEASTMYLKPQHQGFTRDGVVEQYPEFFRLGAPCRFFHIDQIDSIPDAKVYIFWNATRLDQGLRDRVRAKVRRGGAVSVWLYGSGMVGEDGVSVRYQTDLTGIGAKQAGESFDLAVSPDRGGQEAFGFAPNALARKKYQGEISPHPRLVVEDNEARSLGKYRDDGSIAMASKEFGAWRSIVIHSFPVPARVLRPLLREAGVHMYLDGDDVIYVNRTSLAIHAASPGLKKIALPKACEVLDAVTGKTISPAASQFQVSLGFPETRIFLLRP